MDKEKTLVYVVEDDRNIRELVLYALQHGGFAARGFEDAGAFNAALESEPPALVILDIMLPGEDGFAILRRIRAGRQTAALPVMMLTARTSEYDKVTGLDAGVDDYMTKPFGVMELVARVRALLRRTGHSETEAEDVLQCGPIALETHKRNVLVDGSPVGLTMKEFDLLHMLMEKPGYVFERDSIMDTVWGYSYTGETRTVDAHIHSLRAKLGEDAGRMIETVRGVGYRMGGAG